MGSVNSKENKMEEVPSKTDKNYYQKNPDKFKKLSKRYYEERGGKKLKQDYYKANKYEAINGTLLDRASLGSVRLAPYRFDIYRKESPKYIRDRHSFTLSFFCFEKKTNSTSNEIPIQTFYSSMHSDFEQNYEFKHIYNKVLNSYKHKLLGLLPSTLKKRIISLLKNK